jgi:hypothetical protein
MALHTGTTGPVIRADNMEPEVLRQLVAMLSGSRDGVMRSTDYAVTQNGGGAMSVLVSSGFALISGTDSAPAQGQYHVYNDANVTVTVPTANGSNPRIDLICATIEDAYYAGGTNSCILQDVAGTPGASPAVPATPADSLVLAHIYVGTGAASILTANINGTTGTNNPDVNAYTPLRAAGLLGRPTTTGGTITSTSTPGAIIPGLFCVVNVPASRNIRISWGAVTVATSALCVLEPQIVRDGVTLLLGTSLVAGPGAGGFGSLQGFALDAPSAGVHRYQMNIWSNVADTITTYAGSGWMTVEDMGPV